jgi:hypothetical protein
VIPGEIEEKILNRNYSPEGHIYGTTGSHEVPISIKKFNTLKHPFPSTGLNKLRRIQVRVKFLATAI